MKRMECRRGYNTSWKHCSAKWGHQQFIGADQPEPPHACLSMHLIVRVQDGVESGRVNKYLFTPRVFHKQRQDRRHDDGPRRRVRNGSVPRRRLHAAPGLLAPLARRD